MSRGVDVRNDERSSGWLPGLVSLALAVLLWWLGQGWYEDRQALSDQAATTRRLLAHRDSESAESLQAQRRDSTARRQALSQRLGSVESQEMARAGLVYEVRQRCYEIKLNCEIRLAEAVGPAIAVPVAKASDSRAQGSDLLAELGIQTIRAVVTGTLSGQEAVALADIFQRDPQHQWKINRIQFKGKTFEMDVERMLMRIGN